MERKIKIRRNNNKDRIYLVVENDLLGGFNNILQLNHEEALQLGKLLMDMGNGQEINEMSLTINDKEIK